VLEGFELKALGYLQMAQGVAPLMRAQAWGRIVNIAGGGGASPNASNLPLSIANAAVLNLTRALSDELSPDGVLVNVVCPGVTDTPRAAQLYDAKALDDLTNRLPARRVGRPEEVAEVVCFLASNACTYVHGSSIYMDGGGRRATP
jgi:NAD(P)-dependent dehydrogenase (short-subunit alcohol dehydrogenase family)